MKGKHHEQNDNSSKSRTKAFFFLRNFWCGSKGDVKKFAEGVIQLHSSANNSLVFLVAERKRDPDPREASS